MTMAKRRASATASALRSLLAVFLATAPDCTALAAGDAGPRLSHGIDSSNGLTSWRWEDEGVAITLAQRAPDQTRSFFEARGFDPESADLFAEACVFKTVFEHLETAAKGPMIGNDLGQWRVVVDGERRALVLKEEWDRRWRDRGVPRKARIAFAWALFPTHQRFGSGDRQWGMTSYGLPPGERFDLDITWQRDGVPRHARIEDLECAPDVRVGGG